MTEPKKTPKKTTKKPTPKGASVSSKKISKKTAGAKTSPKPVKKKVAKKEAASKKHASAKKMLVTTKRPSKKGISLRTEKTSRSIKDVVTDATANAGEKVKETVKNASVVSQNLAHNAVDAANDTKDSLVAEAKAAYDNIDTDGFQDVANQAQKKVVETARKAGTAMKNGLADHGIDTDKLSSALKSDAKNAATAVVGGAKFASEKLSSFLSKVNDKLSDAASAKDGTDDTE